MDLPSGSLKYTEKPWKHSIYVTLYILPIGSAIIGKLPREMEVCQSDLTARVKSGNYVAWSGSTGFFHTSNVKDTILRTILHDGTENLSLSRLIHALGWKLALRQSSGNTGNISK